jgi:uridine kinase
VVETPQGVLYHGKQSASNKICGVSILRAGETMEQAVCDVCKDIRIGKILIQTNFSTGEPEVSSFSYRLLILLQLLVLFLLFLHR